MRSVVKRNVIKMYTIKIIEMMKLNKILYSVLKGTLINGKVIKRDDIDKVREELNEISVKPSGSACGHNEILKDQADLQIIVPCYNVEKYVRECLDSILNQQTEYSYKLIIVDDGSTDQTPQIVDSYAKYPQVKIIHQKNKGLSGARNTALSKLCGKFVMFVDSDDKIEEGAIQGLLKRAYETGADIVDGGFVNFDSNGIRYSAKGEDLDNVDPYKSIKGISCGKVIKSTLFENVIFPEGFWFEDSITAFLLFPMIKSAATFGEVVYCYRRNTSGITYTSRKKLKGIDTYWILEQMLDDQKKIGISKSQDIYEHVLFQVYINYQRTYWFDEKIKEKIFILSAYILNNEFKGYVTKKSEFTDLENALRNNNYSVYSYYCSLH